MSYTKEYIEFYECDCGEASVGFRPVLGHMDQYWATLNNCTSEDVGYHREYSCNSCGTVFDKADPAMIASEEQE